MKLLIVGSRSITDFDLAPYVSAEVDTVLTGGADGIDNLAEQYADAVLVIWDGRSKGTEYTHNYAKKKNRPVTLVQI